MDKGRLVHKITEAVGLHSESILGTPVLELCKDNRVLIENYQKVLSFDAERISVSVDFGCLCLEGEGLVLDYLGQDRILITGKLQSIAVQRKFGGIQ